MKKGKSNSRMQTGAYKLLCMIIVSVLFMTGCGAIDLSELVQDSSGGIPDSLLTPQSSGTNAWIEFPREGMILEQKAYTFVVYAADAIGISSVSLSLNGEQFPAGKLTDLSSDASQRQVRMDQSWTAPYEGSFTLLASAAGKSGAESPGTLVHFCVVTCDPDASGVEPTDTPTPAAITPTNEPVALFEANPSLINAGKCSELSWTVTGGYEVSLDNATVPESGTKQVCPCVSSSYQLRIDKPDGTTAYLLTEVQVNGSCAGSTTPTWTTQPPVGTTPPPTDTSGPTIEYGNLVFESCLFYGQAYISDPSGVSSAKFGYNLNGGGWLWIWMQDIGGGYWQSEVGISLGGGGMETLPIGDIDYQFFSKDNLGNETYTPVYPTYHYTSCDG